MELPIHLDYAVQTRPSSFTINQMQPFLKRHWEALAAPYLKGEEPFCSIERSLADMERLLGAKEQDALFFSPTPLSDLYHFLYRKVIAENGKNHYVTTPIENQTMYALGSQLERVALYQKRASLNANGQLTPTLLEEALSPKTAFVSLSWANPLTGVIHPIWELSELCRGRGVLFHVDASPILGKLYFKFRELPIDCLTFDGAMVQGPKGSGGLLMEAALAAEADLFQEAELNSAALVGLGLAMNQLAASFDHLCMETARLRDRLEEGITDAIKDAQLLFAESERLPTTTVIAFPGIHQELLAFHLSEQGVYPSFGGGRWPFLKELLTSCQIDPRLAQCALSFSLSVETTQEEIDRAIGIIVDSAQRARTFSTGVVL